MCQGHLQCFASKNLAGEESGFSPQTVTWQAMGQAATDPELGAIATSCILIATPRRGNRENELHIGAEISVLPVIDSTWSSICHPNMRLPWFPYLIAIVKG